MTIMELIRLHGNSIGSALPLFLIIALSLIQVSKIPVKPWEQIAKVLKKIICSIGKALNEDIYIRLDEIKSSQHMLNKKINIVDSNLKKFQDKTENEELQNKRDKILRFYNEIYYRGIGHSREEFDNIIKTYEDYEHTIEIKGFTNGQIDNAYEYIMDEFHRHESNHDFTQ